MMGWNYGDDNNAWQFFSAHYTCKGRLWIQEPEIAFPVVKYFGNERIPRKFERIEYRQYIIVKLLRFGVIKGISGPRSYPQFFVGPFTNVFM
jgi:hypothetical protein